MPVIRFHLNGVATEVDADPDRSLLDILRSRLGLTGTHFGCGSGECGACHVIVGEHAVSSCDTPLWSVADKDITTIAKGWEAPNARIRCSAPSSPNRRCNAAIACRAS